MKDDGGKESDDDSRNLEEIGCYHCFHYCFPYYWEELLPIVVVQEPSAKVTVVTDSSCDDDFQRGKGCWRIEISELLHNV